MTVDRPGCLIWCGQCGPGICARADHDTDDQPPETP